MIIAIPSMMNGGIKYA